MATQALLLNASYEPLQVVSWQKAIQLLFQGKVEVVEESDQEVRSIRISIRIPSVLRLIQYIPLGKKKQLIRFSRTNVFIRDNNVCQYCGTQFPRSGLTLDHVIPVVQAGKKSWDNIVTACKPCNQKKGGRTPQQAAMSLIKKPRQPTWLPQASLEIGISIAPDRWKIYFK